MLKGITKVEDDHYKCGACGNISHTTEWNDATTHYYSGSIVPIEIEEYGCDYICPYCGENVEIDFKDGFNGYYKVEDVTITRERYNELLDIEERYNAMCEIGE